MNQSVDPNHEAAPQSTIWPPPVEGAGAWEFDGVSLSANGGTLICDCHAVRERLHRSIKVYMSVMLLLIGSIVAHEYYRVVQLHKPLNVSLFPFVSQLFVIPVFLMTLMNEFRYVFNMNDDTVRNGSRTYQFGSGREVTITQWLFGRYGVQVGELYIAKDLLSAGGLSYNIALGYFRSFDEAVGMARIIGNYTGLTLTVDHRLADKLGLPR